MKIRERLLECKIKLGIKSDYALAKALQTDRRRISEYMAAKRIPDAYTAVKVAEILKVHPMLLIAEFEAENAKTEERKNWWLNFLQRMKAGALGMVVLISTTFWLPEPDMRIMYIMSNSYFG